MSFADHVGTAQSHQVYPMPTSWTVTVDGGVNRALVMISHRREATVSPLPVTLAGVPPSVTLYSGDNGGTWFSSRGYSVVAIWYEDDLPAPGDATLEFTVESSAATLNLHDVSQQSPPHHDVVVYYIGAVPVTLSPDVPAGGFIVGMVAGRGQDINPAMSGTTLVHNYDGASRRVICVTDASSIISYADQFAGRPPDADGCVFAAVAFAPAGAAPPTRRRSPLLLLPY